MDTIEDVRTTIREAHTRYDEAGIKWNTDHENETREQAIRQQATVLEKALTDLTRMGDIAEGEAVGRAFAILHRTHQQDFLRNVILPILKRLDDDFDTGNFDARNEASCRFARYALGPDAPYLA
jgi:hypothetical protein